MDPSDTLGDNVCKLCADKIVNFFNFRQMFLESEDKLRDHLEQLRKDANYQTDLFAKQPTTNHLNYENEASDGVDGDDVVCDMDDDLNNPTVDAANNLRWKCSKCLKAFSRRIELQLHRHIHRIETNRTPMPSMNDNEPNGLGFYAEEMHIKTEPDEYDSDNLNETIQSHFMDIDMSTNLLPNDNDDELRWTCSTCKAKFLRRAHLRAHRQQHSNQRKPHEKKVSFNKQHNNIPHTATTAPTIEKVFISEMISAKSTMAMGVLANAIKFGNNGKTSTPKTKTKTIATSSSTNGLSAESIRWMCKKCSIPFRTRRLLRDHNLIHRSSGGVNSSMNSTAESSVLDDLIDIQAAVVANEKKTLLSMTTKKSPPPKHSNSNTIKAAVTATGQQIKSFKCQKCRKSFENATKLKRHKMFSHTFEIKLNLKSAPKHISNAMKKIPHDIMSKKKSTMNRSPFVEREWACNSCSLVFSRRQLLREHRRTEHMLKPNGLPLKQEQNAAVKDEQSADEDMVLDSASSIIE